MAHRGIAMALAVSLAFSDPTFGPIFGGFVIGSSLDCRWNKWVVIIVGLGSLLTAYQSFVNGVLFLFYQTYPIAFGDNREWNTTLKYLPLLAIVCGVFTGTLGIVVRNQVYFRHHCHAADASFIPKSRLPPTIVGGIMIPIGMFRFAWTATPAVPWPSPFCASLLIGCGIYLLFIQGFNYIVDC